MAFGGIGTPALLTFTPGDNLVVLADNNITASRVRLSDISTDLFIGFKLGTGDSTTLPTSGNVYNVFNSLASPGPRSGFNVVPTTYNTSNEYYPLSTTVTIPSDFPTDLYGRKLALHCRMHSPVSRLFCWEFYIYFQVFSDPEVSSDGSPESPVVFNVTDVEASFSCPYPLPTPYVTYQPQIYDPAADIWRSCGSDCVGGEVVTATGLTPATAGYKARFIGVPDATVSDITIDGDASTSFTTLAVSAPATCSAYPLGKAISAEYLDMLNHTPTTRALLIKIVRQDGAVFAYTTASSDIDGSDVLEDGEAITELDGVTFISKGGMSPTGISNSVQLNRSDNLDIEALITDDGITDAELSGGLFDGAYMYVCEVNYNDLTQGIMRHKKGFLGEVSFDVMRFKGTFNSMAQKLNSPILERGSILCRVKEFGDARCKMGTSIDRVGSYVVSGAGSEDVNGTYKQTGTYNSKPYYVMIGSSSTIFYTGTAWKIDYGMSASDSYYAVTSSSSTPPLSGWSAHGDRDDPGPTLVYEPPTPATQTVDGYDLTSTGTVTAVDADEPSRIMTLSGIDTIPDGYFNYGKLTITQSGSPIEGYVRKVRTNASSVIELAEAFPFAPEIGDTISIMMGCDRRAETCSQRFDNKVNFRGEDHTPGVNIYDVVDG